MSDQDAVRLQKLIANAGKASRREAERWIEAGRVSLNGKIAKLGDKATLNDRVAIDGELLKTRKKTATSHRTLVLHKPVGVLCTRHDPEGRSNVFELLPRLGSGRWIQVGRLDINTSGLILFTTDGELAHRLMHPSYEIEREYAVRVLGEPDAESINQLLQGVELEDGMGRFLKIEKQHSANKKSDAANHWFHVILKEGRKREVRRLWEAVGHKVNRLMRIRYANIRLHREVKPGEYFELEGQSLNELKSKVKL
ncbi:MAG: rRNA pseudouridine synthase [Gammaproteobacteria bacterium]|nr:rRNA pseudouridine synthase [Gammaproteobacteria bacterium]